MRPEPRNLSSPESSHFDNGQETRIGGNEDSAIPGHSMGNRFV
jgi:hypothetical protein